MNTSTPEDRRTAPTSGHGSALALGAANHSGSSTHCVSHLGLVCDCAAAPGSASSVGSGFDPAAKTARTAWSCATCGTQFEPALSPPSTCPICCDERQYVSWQGQRWATMEELARDHSIRFDDEHGVTTLALHPGFAIDQRAFLLPHGAGNLLWECLSVITPEAVREIESRGGAACMAISHPHFYAAMVDWSEALGGIPVYLHEADRSWVQRSSPNLRFWSGEQLQLSAQMTLVRLSGHFPGSTGLWWKSGPRPGGSLFPGDAIQVGMDRRHASFMYSYPNAIPLRPSVVRALREAIAPLSFADLFGFNRGRQIIGNAREAVDASFGRYLEAVESYCGS